MQLTSSSTCSLNYWKWAKDWDDSDWQGPILDPLIAQTPYAPALLILFKWVLQSAGYIERLKKHYQLFRAAVDQEFASKGNSFGSAIPLRTRRPSSCEPVSNCVPA